MLTNVSQNGLQNLVFTSRAMIVESVVFLAHVYISARCAGLTFYDLVQLVRSVAGCWFGALD